MTLQLDDSDALKILDALALNEEYHLSRDQMNASIHQAAQTRNSPITTTTINARERLAILMREQGVPQ